MLILAAVMVTGGSGEIPRVVLASEVLKDINTNRPLDYDNCTIVGDLNLTRPEIDEDIHFNNTIFLNSVRFDHTRFKGDAYFTRSQFRGDAYFRSSQFSGHADFASTQFCGIADFTHAQFKGAADFREALFNKDAYFLGGHLRTLDITEAVYGKLYIRWESIDSLVYDAKLGDTTYQILMENFKDAGFLIDADNCYYQYRKEQCLHRDLTKDSFMFLLDLGGWIFYGYGKRPLYPIAWSTGLVVVFGLFWHWAGLGRREWPPTARLNSGRSWWHALVFSLTVFLSGTKFFIDPPEMPSLQGRSKALLRRAFIAERALGAFFSILFFLAIGATIMR